MQYRLFLAIAIAVLSVEAQQYPPPAEIRKDQDASADATLTFAAASVKPLLRIPDRGSMAKPLVESGRLRFPATTLKRLLMLAYDVKDFQVVGPGWIDDERFTIEAVMPPETTADQTRAMMRNLLADRFKVQIHREYRSLQTYSLVVAKKGFKVANRPSDSKKSGNGASATDIFPEVPPELTGVVTLVISGQGRITAQQGTMEDLAGELEKLLGVPVTDETHVTAKLDFVLKFSPDGLRGPGGLRLPSLPSDGAAGLEARDPTRDTIFSVLESEVGLKLEQKRGPVGIIVIDHAEKAPTEN